VRYIKFKERGFGADGAGYVSNFFTMCKQQRLISYLFVKGVGWMETIWMGRLSGSQERRLTPLALKK